eukprot:gb/GFBE01022939.1/.p1 GENE.gb/GFBE01022939.1/~~gb/GFBE01022939.1/.p1  ORF type:complete len:643 (+),score=106.77 gb/GFBE01022939.1/:1-1929(+)
MTTLPAADMVHDEGFTEHAGLTSSQSLQTLASSVPDSLAAQLSYEELVVSLFRPISSGESTPHVVSAVRTGLRDAADEFLAQSGKCVHTTSLSEQDVRKRFLTSEIPLDPLPLNEYVDKIMTDFVRDSTRVACGRQIGHMTGSLPQYTPPLAELVTAMNQNVVKTETSKTVTMLERQVTACIHRLIYNFEASFYDEFLLDTESTMGMFTSGGTIANITGLWVARNTALGPDPQTGFAGVEHSGLLRAGLHYGYIGAVVIGSALLHYSLKKATDVLGLGVEGLLSCGYDENYQVRLDEVESALKDCRAQNICVVAVVGIAGATETGSIDDLEALAALAKKYETHFHVDAAWGGPCLFSRSLSPKLKGIEHADSVTIDGHKQLFMPMGCGMILLRNPEKSNIISKTASYIIRQGSSDLGRFTLEGSRPGTAIYMHANLCCIGAKGYEALMDRSVRVCRYMAKALTTTGCFEVLFEPMMNILLYRYVPTRLRPLILHTDHSKGSAALSEADWEELDRANASLQERQKAEGRTFVSRTSVVDVKHQRRLVALRVVIGNPVTEEADIDAVIADQLQLVGEESPAFAVDAMPATMAGEGQDAYWKDYWSRMPEAARLFFLDNAERFCGSLVAPIAPAQIECSRSACTM